MKKMNFNTPSYRKDKQISWEPAAKICSDLIEEFNSTRKNIKRQGH